MSLPESPAAALEQWKIIDASRATADPRAIARSREPRRIAWSTIDHWRRHVAKGCDMATLYTWRVVAERYPADVERALAAFAESVSAPLPEALPPLTEEQQLEAEISRRTQVAASMSNGLTFAENVRNRELMGEAIVKLERLRKGAA